MSSSWRGGLQSRLYAFDPSVPSGVDMLNMADPFKPVACVQDPLNSGQFLLRTDIEFVMDSGVDANIARVAGFPTDSNAGNATGGTLRVIEAADSPVSSGMSTLAQEATLRQVRDSVGVMDDWDETNRAAVNPIAGQAGVAGGAGATGATTQRIVEALDSSSALVCGAPLLANSAIQAFTNVCAEATLTAGASYHLIADEDCHIGMNNAAGTHATANDYLLKADQVLPIRVDDTNVLLHVIRDTVNGNLYIQQFTG